MKNKFKILNHKNILQILILLSLILMSCEHYTKKPINSNTVNKALVIPSKFQLRMRASKIKHPILKPILLDLSDGLSPDEAAVLAVINNPILKASRHTSKVAAVQLIQAGILPNPQISYSFDSPVGGVKKNKLVALGFGLSWDLTSLITRNTRKDSLKFKLKSVNLMIAWKEWQVAQTAKLSVYRLVNAKKQLSIALKAMNIANKQYKLQKKDFGLNNSTIRNLTIVESLAQTNKALYLEKRAMVEKRRLELNRILGLLPEKEILVVANNPIITKSDIPSPQLLYQNISERRLDLLALKAGYKSQESRVRGAIRAQFPQISLGITGAKDADRLYTMGIGISISLPIFNRNQGNIAIERSGRKQLFDEYISRVFLAKTDIAKIIQSINSLFTQRQNMLKIITTKENLVKILGNSVSNGNLNIFEYSQTIIQLQESKLQYQILTGRLTDLAIGLEIASGKYIFTKYHTKKALDKRKTL